MRNCAQIVVTARHGILVSLMTTPRLVQLIPEFK